MKGHGSPFRIVDIHWPKKFCNLTPPGRKRRGRLQQSWESQLTDFMRETWKKVWQKVNI